MDIFEDIDDDGYSEIVHYFEYIGGFTLKEAVNLCLKEALTDSLTPSFTWWGREGGLRSLYNTRLILAIYNAVCNNRYINNPTRSEFQAQMREALRTGKERWRSRARGPGSTHPVNPRPRDCWSDERQQEESRRIRDDYI
ncbi:uncharacterized protein [Polyergus mexicanus]|uniref:uncharacterized protein n=1 Tax=Polyergus mexicanus TaxID=615972 RepID=UPI0038B548C2